MLFEAVLLTEYISHRGKVMKSQKRKIYCLEMPSWFLSLQSKQTCSFMCISTDCLFIWPHLYRYNLAVAFWKHDCFLRYIYNKIYSKYCFVVCFFTQLDLRLSVLSGHKKHFENTISAAKTWWLYVINLKAFGIVSTDAVIGLHEVVRPLSVPQTILTAKTC